MTDNQLKWAWVICLIVIPFLFVHLFPSTYLPRLFSILDTVAPLTIGFLAVFTKRTIRIKGYSNQTVERRICYIAVQKQIYTKLSTD
jgi:hypothetical protein